MDSVFLINAAAKVSISIPELHVAHGDTKVKYSFQ